jgi:hypothetical protein
MSEDNSMGDSRDINTAILERLEKVVESLQENSIQMGKLLAVHNEKLDKQDRIDAVLFEKVESLHREVNRSTIEIKKGCERDIRLIDERLRLMEKKMWSIFGGLAIISFLVSPVGQKILRPFSESSQSRLTPITGSGIIGSVVMSPSEFS